LIYYQNSSLSGQDPAFAGDFTLVRNNQPNLAPVVQQFWQGEGVRVVNLEGPLALICPESDNPYIFCIPEKTWQSVMNLATHWGIINNHMLDLGANSLDNTRQIIEAKGEIPLDKNWENSQMRIFPITLSLNPVESAQNMDLNSKYQSLIMLLKKQTANKLNVVFVHGGQEYISLPRDEYLKQLKSLIDAGADAVIAHHTHVPGPLVIYKGKPIFTGLGNFVFDQDQLISTSTATMIRLRKEGEKVLFESLHY
ncbi:MAG TPA: CapA family protein, partial [Candidatus Gracilibacteria bacterium]|nr:CapA family protein [Candidatus Gracilibacteria bacterium]